MPSSKDQYFPSSDSQIRSKTIKTRTIGKGQGNKPATLTLLEVEKQWTMEHHPQEDKHMSEMGNLDVGCDEDGDEDENWILTTEGMKYFEPNFTAFALAGGKSWLEDGSREPTYGKSKSGNY